MNNMKRNHRFPLSILVVMAIFWKAECSGQVCENPFHQKTGQPIYAFSSPGDSLKVLNTAAAQAKRYDIAKAVLIGIKNNPGAITLLTNAEGDIYMMLPEKDEEECK